MEVPLGEGFLEENLVSQLHFQRLGYHRVRVVWTAPVYSDRGLKAFFTAVCLMTLVKMRRSVDPEDPWQQGTHPDHQSGFSRQWSSPPECVTA